MDRLSPDGLNDQDTQAGISRMDPVTPESTASNHSTARIYHSHPLASFHLNRCAA